MEYLQNLLDAAYAARWLITFVIVALLIALIARVVGERDDARAEARRLYMENAELRGRLRASGVQVPVRRKRPIIAGRVIS
ncbi:MAG TPA: hypothetical protein VLI04_02015 [Nocardioidaceae bacterium]|nr:hypothetical protein [Nocardioidaceae bacterium]